MPTSCPRPPRRRAAATHAPTTSANDALGGGVAFTVARDWSRLPNNAIPGPGNADGSPPACGDGLFEPCPPGYLDTTPQPDPALPGGCNHLDAAHSIPALPTGCSNPIVLLAYLLGIVQGNPPGLPPCAPTANSWTVPGSDTLASFAGADGSVVVFIKTGTMGAVWTE